MNKIRDRAEVVIVGGGIVGTSTAFHLAQLGRRDVILVEREAVGAGSTARSAGMIKLQFSGQANVKLSLLSLEIFRSLESLLDRPIGFVECGLATLVWAGDEARYRENVAIQQRLGVPASFIGVPELRELNPHVVGDGLAGATWCPADGYASPSDVMSGLADAARRVGVRIQTGFPAVRVLTANGRVDAVEVADRSIECRYVVNAAGPWAAPVAATAGIDLPVVAIRRVIIVTKPMAASIPRNFPMLSDFRKRFYMRPEVGGLLIGVSNAEEPPSWSTEVDWPFIERALPDVTFRLPILEQAEALTAWGGLIDYSPDHHPILGAVPGLEGFLCANGFSGHGFMHGPAAGRLIAEQIVHGQARSMDVDHLSIRRFEASPPPGLGLLEERMSHKHVGAVA